MGIELQITPYGDGDLRVMARGWCSGLLCPESREMQDQGEELFPRCELVVSRTVIPADELQQSTYQEVVMHAVATALMLNCDLASRIRH